MVERPAGQERSTAESRAESTEPPHEEEKRWAPSEVLDRVQGLLAAQEPDVGKAREVLNELLERDGDAHRWVEEALLRQARRGLTRRPPNLLHLNAIAGALGHAARADFEQALDDASTLEPPRSQRPPQAVWALSPLPRSAEPWVVLVDESFIDRVPYFVAVVVPPDVSPPINTVHATEDHATAFRRLKQLRTYPVGLFGLTGRAVPSGDAESWTASIAEFLRWLGVLLPVSVDRDADYVIEIEEHSHARAREKAPGLQDALATALHARGFDGAVTLRIRDKKSYAWGGWPDVLSNAWTASDHRAEKLKQYGWHQYLLDDDAAFLAPMRTLLVDRRPDVDAWWTVLLCARRREHPIGRIALDSFDAFLRSGEADLAKAVECVCAHLDSGRVDMDAVCVAMDRLEPHASAAGAPTGTVPALLWPLARLRRSNRSGAVDVAADLAVEEAAASLGRSKPELCGEATLVRVVQRTNRFDLDGALELVEPWLAPAERPEFFGAKQAGRIWSQIGQLRAMRADRVGSRDELAGALGDFAHAIRLFGELPGVEAEREIRQTLTYLAVAQTCAGDDLVSSAEREATFTELLDRFGLTTGVGLLSAVQTLATDDGPSLPFVHHALLRWLVRDRPAALVSAYTDARHGWSHGAHHPWALIELQRALLLEPLDVDATRTCLARAREGCAGGGPAIRYIGAVIALLESAITGTGAVPSLEGLESAGFSVPTDAWRIATANVTNWQSWLPALLPFQWR